MRKRWKIEGGREWGRGVKCYEESRKESRLSERERWEEDGRHRAEGGARGVDE